MNLRWYSRERSLLAPPETVLQVETEHGWEDVPVVSAQEERQQEAQRAEEKAYEEEQRAALAEKIRRRDEDPRLGDFERCIP